MGTPSQLQQQKRDFTRSRLVDAAREVFAVKGYVAATIDDIAAAAGASRATFYLHFPSKLAVAAAMLTELNDHLVERYEALDQGLSSRRTDKRELLHEWLRDWLGFWRGNSSLLHAMVAAQMIDPDIEQKSLAANVLYIDSMTRFLNAQPEDRRGEVRDRALILEMMTRSVFDLASRHVLPVSDERMLDYLAETWERLFLAASGVEADEADEVLTA